MDLNELAACTGLPVRGLRYVFDHRVLPGLEDSFPGHGIPRTFTEFEGFGIALAARLLGAGLTRKIVSAGLATAFQSVGTRPEAPLLRAYTVAAGTLEIGDGQCLRVRVPEKLGIGRAFDTGWLPMTPTEAAVDYIPSVLVSVELGGLARAIQERESDKGQA